jgi:rRNA maturation endonuclease Nob1
MNRQATYGLVVALLALSVYLKSPIVGVFSVVLMGLDFAREILMKNQVVKEVEELKSVNSAIQTELNVQRMKIEEVNKELVRVTQRLVETTGGDF